MRRKLLLLALSPVLLLGAVLAVLSGSGDRVQADHVPGHPTIQVLGRSRFIDEVSAQFKLRLAGTKPQNVIHVPNATEAVVLKLTFAPGDEIPWHTHPGPGTVVVVEGELTITNANDCVPRRYAAGEAFLDPGSPNVHRADNLGNVDAVVYSTLLGVPPGVPPTTFQERPSC